ncbi:leucine--tRNA ligase [candidate division KSB1 bacterium]|nr:leucine--tRNA ligase [candidate division KSB1 bacterium]RQW00386.1 MAG: leucine--tRNA ligase [candidate division KSB1 bacterium]
MIPDYDFAHIEKKWQSEWEKNRLYHVDLTNTKNKLYCLVMFLYPSGDRLHIGHWYNYAPTDTWARFKKMQGYNIFEPMGYDAFGLPAENYAIKHGVHPATSTNKNIKNIREQLKVMGAMYDWECEIDTSKPEYYKWTQWLFLQLYKNGLAYRKRAAVNWCPSCQTVLANEQVIDGQCERCEAEVTQKDLEQWFFKITDYAEKLLEGHDRIDWPEKTINMQKNWIGKSVGASIQFKVKDSVEIIEVFTTRPDTTFGVTYMVLAPEHPLVEKLTTETHKHVVQDYITQAKKTKEIDRLSTEREKTGVFIGSYCINPVNQETIPIWIADYVLATYGTGAVMAVPAHDQRDFEFAQKYNLPIRQVISANGDILKQELEVAYVEPGIMVNSGGFDGMDSEKGKAKIIKWFQQHNCGGAKVHYKLRDWLISRQRYWGAPIPIIYCKKCGQVPVPEDELPVQLPEQVDFTGRGISPIATAPDFVNTVCHQCGGEARREVDTMDTFVCSSWYFLRYPNAKLADRAFDPDRVNEWLPVDQYVGGAEHAVMHLLYARFMTKVLHDLGYIAFDEPFQKLIHQGTITNAGAKMSKSRGNVVNPDTFIEQYGSDTFRMYMMFMGSYEDGGDWSDEGISGIYRFLKRVWRLVLQVKLAQPAGDETDRFGAVVYQMHYAIKHASQSLERFHFNTAISRIMELVNECYLYLQDIEASAQNSALLAEVMPTIVQLIAPFCPHMAEELWQILEKEYSVFNSNWPDYDETMLERNTINLGVQVNGKIRGQVQVATDASEKDIIELALQQDKVRAYTEGKTIIKSFVVPEKLVVFAVK